MTYDQLVVRLTEAGVLDSGWAPVFAATPRAWFIPDTVWAGEDLTPVSRCDDPHRWLAAVNADAPLVTQVDDGAVAPGREPRVSSSSASMPTAVALMLHHLAARPGHSVLEIGTGTGWNAALLTHRLGGENVTSIEIDAGLAEVARKNLEAAGRHPFLITGDGTLGWPERGPYDRVLSTAAVATVPYPWVRQTRPGGLIVTPWGNAFFNGSLLRIEVAGDGAAIGRIVDEATFMHLRNQRWTLIDTESDAPDAGRTPVTMTRVHPWYVTGDAGAMLAIGQRVRACTRFADAGADGEVITWFVDRGTRSWASLRYAPDVTEFEVHQAGPRSLWNEIEAAYAWWVDAGEPGPERYGITVNPAGQTVWLDSPERHVTAPAE